MSDYKGMGMLMAALSLGLATSAFGQDAFPEPSTSVQPGSMAEEAEIGTIEVREDDLGVARDDPEYDMQGTSALDEPDSRQERDAGSPYADLEPDDPGLDEPRQPIRPGQMEQERGRQE
ncbi:MAG: hypothetical protein LPK20_00965 [Halomonas sp.]|uniref:Uncharacterized protein n=1 Tax=Billgrantia tianxiuensis TaxID=2497861 RepID=A0A6I6SUN7_9GAMM|nr:MULTISPECIES: hypothetical protein [Halomonas]MCE8035545.1 hypothetical protein [Halomonas sp. MCCC 1A11057]MDX5432125.1 hypothetical protein [Halomonas sp.]QHC51665.1 hypothetical protein EKK97_21525 [Halomonas tianxiuensis]